MNTARYTPPLGSVRRRPVTLRPEEMAVYGKIDGCGKLPLVVEPKVDGLSLSVWAKEQPGYIEELVTQHGAVLMRGFAVTGVPDFEECVVHLCGGALKYQFRASPRTEVGRHVYTATDYPADQFIFPHNEHSYSPVCPTYLVFFSDIPAAEGGETPIGDNREITRLIDPEVKEKFRRLGVLYVRNYGAGFGLPWPVVFQTEDRLEVERYCSGLGIAYEWKSNGRLCTRQTGPALIRHPRTGEEIWFNHATFFHVTTLPAAIRDTLLSEFAEDDLPAQTYYGNGSPIEDDVLEHLRGIYLRALCQFRWRANDVLMVDNILTVHGRNAYRGVRRILVAMGQAFRPADFASEAGAAP
ncbi:MAG TPA: TauD/TfdA family dioxygenase [Methylocella sp.]|nr:TauD/TfdA family dioxygenase [Methylocella sp.]